jgi:hypothetical protein
MAQSEQTSLDRYLLNNGSRLLGEQPGPAGVKLQVIFGAILTVLSLILMPLGFIYGWQVFVALLGPLLGGAINLAVGLTLYGRIRRAPVGNKVQLSPEARSLLASTLNKMGGRMLAWARQNGDLSTDGGIEDSGMPIWNPPALKSSKEVLNERCFGLLNEAAHECNRIQACLTGSQDTAILRRAMIIATASDEGMAQVLQQAALLERFPESGSATEFSARRQIESLREIADRLEAMHTREPLLTDRMDASNTVDHVLDELRLESLARQELTTEPSRTEIEQGNQG